MDDVEARELAARVERLLERLDELPAQARDTALEAVAALLDLYGEGLGRIVSRVPPDALVGDEVIAHLLMVHDLHPEPIGARVEAALDEVRPYLRSHGGEVELLAVREGVVSLRLRGSCSGCPASRTTLELAVEDAVRRRVPEVEDIQAQDGDDRVPATFTACPLPMAPGAAG
jgi:Fe-S cluster biogenesis protein NfuA